MDYCFEYEYIFTCRVVRVMKITDSGADDRIISTLVTSSHKHT
jgi:hypothetical protein